MATTQAVKSETHCVDCKKTVNEADCPKNTEEKLDNDCQAAERNRNERIRILVDELVTNALNLAITELASENK